MFWFPIKYKWTYWIVRVIATGIMILSILFIMVDNQDHITFFVLMIVGISMWRVSIEKVKWNKKYMK